jgi:hypothetical protein
MAQPPALGKSPADVARSPRRPLEMRGGLARGDRDLNAREAGPKHRRR